MSYSLHKTKSDKLADGIMYIGLGVFSIVTLFPLYFVFVMSITPFTEVIKNGGFVIIPTHFTWEAYKAIFSSSRIPRALEVSMVVTVIGTFLSLAVTLLLAYPLSKRFVPALPQAAEGVAVRGSEPPHHNPAGGSSRMCRNGESAPYWIQGSDAGPDPNPASR